MTPRRLVPPVSRPPLSHEEAAARISQIAETVERLTAVITEETRLVRIGAYDAAGRLAGEKGELSGRYMLAVDGLSSNAQAVAAQPAEQVSEVERLHADFRAALDENLLVLGTARSVAESLLRGVAEEIGQKGKPQTYDSKAGGLDQRPRAAPISLSRGA
ncbi:hypothetical protein [Methylopila sp. M107]|uniref:hypothetical protein n=1 Tax=Methylopila sp. M107 TaxID=1101190 RepID=UPI00039EB88D|nr:hypothetical protein [Methylopila sp. M107]